MAHLGRHGMGMGMGWSEIRKGADVYGSDNKKIGDVADVATDYIHISKGFLFTTDLYIPKDAVSNVQDGKVYLNVPSDRIERMHWTEEPRGHSTERGGRLGEREGEMRVPVREEEIDVGKRMKQVGEVEVSKEVTEERRTMRVPRFHEEVTVERERVDRPSDKPVGEGETLRVPIREEEIHVEKRPVVREELVIKKRPVVEEEEVSETIRKEHPRVERHGTEGRYEHTEGRYEQRTGAPPRGAGTEEYIDVQKGWDVFCSDGKKIGDVEDVTPNYIHIKKGFLFTKDLYIPSESVRYADYGKVYLDVPCDRVDSMNWGEPPRGTRLGR